MKASMQNPVHSRKTLLAWCMILAPPLSLAAAIAHPKNEHDTIAQLAVVREHPDVWYLSHILNFGTVFLLAGAVIGVAYMLREREWKLGVAGAAFSFLGLLGSAAYIGVHGFVTWRAATADDQAVIGPFLEHIWSSPGVIGPILVGGAMLGVGTTLLAIGLYRAKIAPLWAVAALVLSPTGVAFGGPDTFAVNIFVQGGAVLLIMSLSWLGVRVLRQSDEDWQHQPEYKPSRRTSAGVARPAERTTA